MIIYKNILKTVFQTSVIFTTQNLFYDSPIMRTVTKNAHHLVIFKGVRMNGSVQYLSSQLFPNKPKFLPVAFRLATENKRFSYLWLNLHPAVENEKLRLISSILPSEAPTIVYLPQ